MERDKIDEILRDSLQNVDCSSDAPSWEDFSLYRKRRRKGIYIRYITIGSAVAACVAIGLIVKSPLELNQQMNEGVTSHEPMVSSSLPTHSVQSVSEVVEAFSKTNARVLSVNRSVSEYTSKTEPVIESFSYATDKDQYVKADGQDVIEDQDLIARVPSIPWIQNDVKQQEKVVDQKIDRKKKTRTITFDNISSRRRIAMITFGNIPGQSYDGRNSEQPKKILSPGLSYISAGEMQEFINFSNSELSHKFPITFGVGVSIPVYEGVSVDTGLSYTSLESESQTMQGYTYKYTQRVNYLGVPVSLRYKFLDTKLFDAYLSAGMTTEVALRAEGKTEIFDRDKFMSSKTEDVMAKGIQISVNAAAGVNMHLSKTVGLYAEPSISHYMPNNKQPMTYCKQSSVVFNLRVGLKFQL